MSENVVDLIDYSCLKLPLLAAIPKHSLELKREIRLHWIGDHADEVTGFAFKPEYSYEREAVSERTFYKPCESRPGWVEFSGESSDAGDALAELLDATLWRGRPVLQGMADYWMAVDLSEQRADYELLFNAVNQSRSVAAFDSLSPDNELFTSTKKDHNLIAPVWRLLRKSTPQQEQKSRTFTCRLVADQAFVGEDESCKKIKAIVANVDLYLYFMEGQLLLIKWRMQNRLPEKSNHWKASLDASSHQQYTAKQAWLDVLAKGPGREAGYLTFDEWLSVKQSLRWQSQSFKEQLDEGRLLADIEDALFDSLKQALNFHVAGKGMCGEYILSLADNRDMASELPARMHDPRFHSSWAVSLLSAHPGQHFNGALQRAWAHLLGNDTPYSRINGSCDNYAFDREFSQNWVAERTYKRWADTGIQYGFSDFSVAAMGTSKFFRAQVFHQDWPGLYSELTRLCIFQQTRLRSMAMAFSDTLDSADTCHVEAMQKRIKNMRDELQRFNRNAWFHRISTQLQPEELYQHQKAAMDLEGLYRSVRDEFEDVSAWLAAEQSVLVSKEATRQQKRDRLLALIGLAIAVPGVLQIWGAGQDLKAASEPSRGLFAALWAMFCSIDFWLLVALVALWDQFHNAGRWRQRLWAWFAGLFS